MISKSGNVNCQTEVREAKCYVYVFSIHFIWGVPFLHPGPPKF